MQPYAHDEAAISAPGLAKRAAWAGSIAAVRQMPTGPMLRCILLAAAGHAFPASDAERTAFTYLINGTEPADGLLEVDAAAAASAHVGMLANSGRIAPTDAALCADRARRAGLPHAAAALFNNVALLCGEIYGGDASCDRGEMYERAHDAAPGLAGVTLNYAYFLEQRDDPLAISRGVATFNQNVISVKDAFILH